ncbi:hypothetical protein [Pseudomonas weihenstephanensis]|uniref:hypothetical protein n=1 Tax=Pseudomonas weihenstephanensis TaxID=1608994 RepID=UPI000A94D27C|nr:hypothetical protein [Pseudomonas weihenstephanensis]
MRANELSNEDISLLEVYIFFTRQIKTILMIFFVACAVGIAYSTTRPTLYMSVSNATIGKSISLDSNTLGLLESPEEIAYNYSSIATITPIKNTNIVKVSSTTEDRKQSIENVKSTIEKITKNQKEIYQSQENKFIKYLEILKITDAVNARTLDILQIASKSSATHSSEMVTTELPYSGKIKQNLLLTAFIAALVALTTGGLKELCRRGSEKKQLHN